MALYNWIDEKLQGVGDTGNTYVSKSGKSQPTLKWKELELILLNNFIHTNHWMVNPMIQEASISLENLQWYFYRRKWNGYLIGEKKLFKIKDSNFIFPIPVDFIQIDFRKQFATP